jgi:hypothetical protein
MSGFYCENIGALKSGPQLYSVMNQALNEAPGIKDNGPGVQPNRNGHLNSFKPIQKDMI